MDQQELLPMRLARVRAGDPTSGRLECCSKSVLARSASYSSVARNARRLPQSRSPERPLLRHPTKKPLCGSKQGQVK